MTETETETERRQDTGERRKKVRKRLRGQSLVTPNRDKTTEETDTLHIEGGLNLAGVVVTSTKSFLGASSSDFRVPREGRKEGRREKMAKSGETLERQGEIAIGGDPSRGASRSVWAEAFEECPILRRFGGHSV